MIGKLACANLRKRQEVLEYLQERAKREVPKKFEAVLAKVPNGEPEAVDRLPSERPERTSRKCAGQGQSVNPK